MPHVVKLCQFQQHRPQVSLRPYRQVKQYLMLEHYQYPNHIHLHQVKHVQIPKQFRHRHRCRSPIVPHAVKLHRCQQRHPQASL